MKNLWIKLNLFLVKFIPLIMIIIFIALFIINNNKNNVITYYIVNSTFLMFYILLFSIIALKIANRDFQNLKNTVFIKSGIVIAKTLSILIFIALFLEICFMFNNIPTSDKTTYLYYCYKMFGMHLGVFSLILPLTAIASVIVNSNKEN